MCVGNLSNRISNRQTEEFGWPPTRYPQSRSTGTTLCPDPDLRGILVDLPSRLAQHGRYEVASTQIPLTKATSINTHFDSRESKGACDLSKFCVHGGCKDHGLSHTRDSIGSSKNNVGDFAPGRVLPYDRFARLAHGQRFSQKGRLMHIELGFTRQGTRFLSRKALGHLPEPVHSLNAHHPPIAQNIRIR